MKKLIQQGDSYYLNSVDSVGDRPDPGNYLLKYDDQRRCYYLQKKEAFKLPSKIYGDYSIIDRWSRSFKVNSLKNMGILLSGTKGTGKTQIAQQFCIKENRPVIMINQAFGGTDFIDFLTDPVFSGSIIMVDEFEKIYGNQNTEDDYQAVKSVQKDFLSLMDGNFATQLIFILTVNDVGGVDTHLINRLSRIKYNMTFTGLTAQVVEEIIEDLLQNKAYKEEIYEVFTKVGLCTMDLLIPLINEVNLFKESPKECAKYLNLKCENRYYSVMEIYKGQEKMCNPLSFSLDDQRIQICREWLQDLKKLSVDLRDESIWQNIIPGKDKIETITRDEIKITTTLGRVFKCTVKEQNISVVF